MTDTLKIQLHQEAKKMEGTGRGKLFESALERINELERQQSEAAAQAAELLEQCTTGQTTKQKAP